MSDPPGSESHFFEHSGVGFYPGADDGKMTENGDCRPPTTKCARGFRQGISREKSLKSGSGVADSQNRFSALARIGGRADSGEEIPTPVEATWRRGERRARDRQRLKKEKRRTRRGVRLFYRHCHLEFQRCWTAAARLSIGADEFLGSIAIPLRQTQYAVQHAYSRARRGFSGGVFRRMGP